MSRIAPVAFLFDVDNTLLDNDRVRAELAETIERIVGPERGEAFWESYEQVRRDRDYVDYPNTIARFGRAFPDEVGYPDVADAILGYPYRAAVFPGAHDVLRQAQRVGPVAILTDGDPVYQPAKVARAGLTEAIDGPVLVFDHKEQHLAEVERRVPAERYVMVDDKPRILAAMSDRLGERMSTLHVCQGRYAHAAEHDEFPDADRTVDAIAELLDVDLASV